MSDTTSHSMVSSSSICLILYASAVKWIGQRFLRRRTKVYEMAGKTKTNRTRSSKFDEKSHILFTTNWKSLTYFCILSSYVRRFYRRSQRFAIKKASWQIDWRMVKECYRKTKLKWIVFIEWEEFQLYILLVIN